MSNKDKEDKKEEKRKEKLEKKKLKEKAKLEKKLEKDNNRAKSPLAFFFKFGEKVTKGDPVRKAQFDYYMLWLMFLAFTSVFVSSMMTGIKLVRADEIWLACRSFGWGLIMVAILWFQYFALKQTWTMKKNMENLTKIQRLDSQIKKKTIPIKEGNLDDMLNEFKEEK